MQYADLETGLHYNRHSLLQILQIQLVLKKGHKYENPGTHDLYLNGPNPYNSSKSVIPKNHEELWQQSRPSTEDGNRWTKAGKGNNPPITASKMMEMVTGIGMGQLMVLKMASQELLNQKTFQRMY